MKIRRKPVSWDSEDKGGTIEVIYGIDDNPPWYLATLLGLQHYLTMVGAAISVPFVLSGSLCIQGNPLAISKLISSVLFCSGIITLVQATVGVRLPIVQGGSFTFTTPTFAILGVLGACDDNTDWKDRIVEVQGAIMVSSCFQIGLGLFGGIGILLRFIGPLTVTPAITLVGLSLFDAGSHYGSASWPVTAFGIVCITLFSQVLSRLSFFGIKLFKLFPVVLAMGCTWLLCFILTESGAFSSDVTHNEYRARTDKNSDVIQDSNWFRVPYPLQWGTPKVTAAGVFGMLAGVLAGMVESIGDYFACARLSGAPVPTVAAVNRGILVEGLGCLLAGLIGTSNGTTSYSENIGAIGITKVGSRRVILCGSVIMIFVGCFSKICALFATIPDPVIGANFFCMFGMITAVGLSNLQFINLNSSRNLFILGFSLFAGLSLPLWINDDVNKGYVDTGNEEVDQIIEVLLGTGMFIGGLCGFIMDNLIPGNEEDRGIKKWRVTTEGEKQDDGVGGKKVADISTYDIPFITQYLNKVKITKFIPICPAFMRESEEKKRGLSNNRIEDNNVGAVVGEPVHDNNRNGTEGRPQPKNVYKITSL
ncbi:solute carrier family 23 member 1-like isoform X2 [Convolutriloba macropyga]|uniref:solute carrier family 23 member 1-like isoform X2 n=1 Tax=Convolutriloba macropyga TaxID=536237 RepID=UPI003F51B5D9